MVIPRLFSPVLIFFHYDVGASTPMQQIKLHSVIRLIVKGNQWKTLRKVEPVTEKEVDGVVSIELEAVWQKFNVPSTCTLVYGVAAFRWVPEDRFYSA